MKKWMIIPAILVISLFGLVLSEWKLLTSSEIAKLERDMFTTFFYPFGARERKRLITDFLEEMEDQQHKVDTSIIAKYFVDYRDRIADDKTRSQEFIDLDNAVTESKNISFWTLPSYHHIAAWDTFERDEDVFEEGKLFEFGKYFEKHFKAYPGELSALCEGYSEIDINLTLDENASSEKDMIHFGKEKMHSFLLDFCDDAFPEKTVRINVYSICLSDPIATYSSIEAKKDYFLESNHVKKEDLQQTLHGVTEKEMMKVRDNFQKEDCYNIPSYSSPKIRWEYMRSISSDIFIVWSSLEDVFGNCNEGLYSIKIENGNLTCIDRYTNPSKSGDSTFWLKDGQILTYSNCTGGTLLSELTKRFPTIEEEYNRKGAGNKDYNEIPCGFINSVIEVTSSGTFTKPIFFSFKAYEGEGYPSRALTDDELKKYALDLLNQDTTTNI